MMLPIHVIAITLMVILALMLIQHQSTYVEAGTSDIQVHRKLGNTNLSGPSAPLTHTHNVPSIFFSVGPWDVGTDFTGERLFQGCDTSSKIYNKDGYTVRLQICYSIYQGVDGYYLKDIYFGTLIDTLPEILSSYYVKTDISSVVGSKSPKSRPTWTVAQFSIQYTIYATNAKVMEGIILIHGDGVFSNIMTTFVGGDLLPEATLPKIELPKEEEEILPRGRWVRVNKGRSQISVQYSVGYSVEDGKEDSITRAQAYSQSTEQSTSHEFSTEVYGEVTASASFFGVGVSATVGFSATYTEGSQQMVGYSRETSSEVGKSAFSSVTHEYSETVQVGCGDELGFNLFIYEVEAPNEFKVIPKPIIAWCKMGSMPPVCPPSNCMDDECTYCKNNTFKDPNFDKIMSNSTMGERLQALDPDAPKTKAPTSTDPNVPTYIGLGVGIPCAVLLLSFAVFFQLRKRKNKSKTSALQDKAQKESLIQSQNPSYLVTANPASFASKSNVTQPQSNISP